MLFGSGKVIDFGTTRLGDSASASDSGGAESASGQGAPKERPTSVHAMLRQCFPSGIVDLPAHEGAAGVAFEVAKGALALGTELGSAALGEAPSPEDEQQIAAAVEKKILSQHARSTNQQAIRRVEAIAKRLTAHSPAGRPYRFTVLASSDLNAMMTPGRNGYVFEGLIDAMPDDDALAFVIAHELGHSELGHQDAALRIAMAGASLGRGLGQQAEELGKMAGLVATHLLKVAYDQDQEYSSDRFGVCTVHLAGYDASAAPTALRRLTSGDAEEGPGSHVAERIAYDILSSHPPIQTRITYARKLASSLGARR
jgi:putative metalloprotease